MTITLATEDTFSDQTNQTVALVVDDSPSAREAIAQYLLQFGFRVLFASNAGEAIQQISKNRPNIILLDVVLPDRSGFALCRDLKAKVETTNIPIILCSIKKTNADKFWGLKQGANAYLCKPIAEFELLSAINNCLGVKSDI
ncbi:response regulator [Calothrix sp. FACHB-1219]|uniref:response regulator transcription factor n=1 Tax=unclassified Calothrix TaxID=2619626 RepID=UPI0016844F94|nr:MULTISPECIES: response regulator [unclassified Calothrix]MBD2202646.1 response regulator [Calothrix sp. FACHB-168]MBD2221724.1 response regulator [Calothrix sp. FACHB-1219]